MEPLCELRNVHKVYRNPSGQDLKVLDDINLQVFPEELLCMDEPFSQVDALTAENLRAEAIRFWSDKGKNPSSILMVSHDIKEVVFMATRIVVLAAHPGRIRTIIENKLPYPRDPRSKDF